MKPTPSKCYDGGEDKWDKVCYVHGYTHQWCSGCGCRRKQFVLSEDWDFTIPTCHEQQSEVEE